MTAGSLARSCWTVRRWTLGKSPTPSLPDCHLNERTHSFPYFVLVFPSSLPSFISLSLPNLFFWVGRSVTSSVTTSLFLNIVHTRPAGLLIPFRLLGIDQLLLANTKVCNYITFAFHVSNELLLANTKLVPVLDLRDRSGYTFLCIRRWRTMHSQRASEGYRVR